MTAYRPLNGLIGLCLILPIPVAARSADPPLKVVSAEAIRGTRNVVIGAFSVGFIFESVDNTEATGGLIGAFGGTTRAKSELVGVTPAMMQSITDAAYADFQQRLVDHGFIVSDAQEMFGSANFARVKQMASPYEISIQLDKKSKGKTSYYKPNKLPGIVFLPGDVAASGFGGIGIAMAAGTNQFVVAQHAKASGQAVIDVVYLIDFSDAKRPGAFSFGGGVSVTSGMSVVGGYSKLNIVTTGGKLATITLKHPVAVEGDFAEMRDATKNAGAQQAMNVAGGFLAAAGFGGMKFGKSKTFVFTAKPGVYEQGAIKAATLANARLIDQLSALR